MNLMINIHNKNYAVSKTTKLYDLFAPLSYRRKDNGFYLIILILQYEKYSKNIRNMQCNKR